MNSQLGLEGARLADLKMGRKILSEVHLTVFLVRRVGKALADVQQYELRIAT